LYRDPQSERNLTNVKTKENVECPIHHYSNEVLPHRTRRSLKMVADAVEGLPQDRRLVLALRYVEELSMQEIATVLGVSESRASQLHTETMTQLHANLKHDDAR
jgi:RNA polymerase sigma factor (sigma-70 family)